MPSFDVANLHLDFPGGRRRVSVPLPVGPHPAIDLLPAARELADATAAAAVDAVSGAGRAVSCRAGCAACCRQLVAVSPLEAHGLAATVDALPPERRAIVQRRFAEAIERFVRAGLLRADAPPGGRMLVSPTGQTPAEMAVSAARAYFEQGVACPFLENESCSIYAQRPLVCRQYNVTSPAERCLRPFDDDVDLVGLTPRVADALADATAPFGPAKTTMLPLILSLEFAAAHPSQFRSEHNGVTLFESLLLELDRAFKRERPPL